METSFNFSKKKKRKTGISRSSRAVRAKKCTKKYAMLLQHGWFLYKHFCRFCRSCLYLITQGVWRITLIWVLVAGSGAAWIDKLPLNQYTPPQGEELPWKTNVGAHELRSPPPGGGGLLLGYVSQVSHNTYPIVINSVANYRPRVSHFWVNVIFAIPP